MGWFEDFAEGAQGVSNAIGEGIVDSAEWVGDTATDAAEWFIAPVVLAQNIYNAIDTDPEVNAYNAAISNVKSYKPPRKTIKVLGVSELSIHERTEGYITGRNKVDFLIADANSTVDTTTYTDRAVIRLYNGLGYNCYLTSLTIDGKRIMQYSGEAGELIHDSLKRDDDIRRNGETVFEIGNEYIVDATQCAKIADYWYKFLGKKKHIYSLSIPGCAPWYNAGDWYNLQVGEADTNEYIDAVVECYAVDVEKSAGGIGSTTLLLRDVEDNWAKTTLYATRLATGGSPKRRVNRSNIVTVASSTYDGTYDYKCDGTDDDVQIQAAIDYVSNTWDGGTVQLTNGTYTLGATLTMKSAIILKGVGNSTILSPESASVTTMVDFGTATGSSIVDFIVDGNGTSITFTTHDMKVIDGQNIGTAQGIIIQNYTFSCTSLERAFYIYNEINATSCMATGNVMTNTGTTGQLHVFYKCNNLVSCSAFSNISSGAAASLYVFNDCNNASSCQSYSNSITDGASLSVIISFNSCDNLSSCSSYSNSTAGASAYLRSFISCDNLSSCSSYSNSTAGASAMLLSFNSCDNLSSCSSYSNSTAGASADIDSFNSCKNITVCTTSGNVSTLSSEYGFRGCKSVQQCKSSGDSNPYTTSYSDAGTTNAAADTAAGGYNS